MKALWDRVARNEARISKLELVSGGSSGPIGVDDVTGLQALLDAKQAAGSYALTSHDHSGLYQPAGSYAATVHTHAIENVTGLTAALDAKQAAGSYAAASHGHVIADVTGLQGALDGKQAAGSYAASAHSHIIGDVTGLQTALDGKQATGSYSLTSHNHDAAYAAIGHNHSGVYQPFDTQLTDLAGLAYANNSLKVLRVNAGETSFELVAPSAGAPTLTTVEVDLGSTPRWSGMFVIPGSGMTIGKPVFIQQAVGPYTNKGTRADEAEMDMVRVTGSVTSATAITCYWNSPYKVAGNFKFDYLVGA